MAWQNVKIDEDHGRLRVGSVGPSIDYSDIYGALWKHLGDRRGWDTWSVTRTKADGSTLAETRRCPLTTYADVVQLSLFWSTQMIGTRRTRAELDGRRRSWAEAHGEVIKLAKGARPGDVYPKNREWWLAAMRAAVAIDVEREDGDGPSQMDLIVGFFTDTVPDVIGAGLTWAGKKLEEGAEGIGHLAGRAARGALDGLGLKEILIGAGVIAGAAIVLPAMSRSSDRERKAGAS